MPGRERSKPWYVHSSISTPHLGPEPRRAGLDDGLDGLFDLLAGEGPLRVAEGQAEVDALLVVGEVAALEGVEVVDRLERRGRPSHGTAADELGPGQRSRRRPARGRGRRPGTAAAAGTGRPARPGSIRTSNSSSAAEQAPRSSNAVELGRGRPRRGSRGASRPGSSSAARPGAKQGDLDRAGPPAVLATCSRASSASTIPLSPRKSRPVTRASRVGSSGRGSPARGR